MNQYTPLAEFYDVIRAGLKEKLGCVLFQMPPSLAYSEVKLKQITESLDTSFRNVLEFRHTSWWHEPVIMSCQKKISPFVRKVILLCPTILSLTVSLFITDSMVLLIYIRPDMQCVN